MTAHPDDVRRHLQFARAKREDAERGREEAMKATARWLLAGGKARIPVSTLAEWSGLTRRTVYRYLPDGQSH